MSRLLLRPVVIAIFTYLLALGATFNGIVNAEIPPLTLGLATIVVAFWLFIRWRRGWKWHRTPLDIAFLFWIAAFVISLLANMDAARRIAIGLWYVSVYIGIWFILQDSLANRALTRDVLVDALLVSGFIIVVIGYWQLQSWLTKVFNLGFNLLTPPRPVSIFGNPNFLSGFLIVLIPFLFSRLILSRGRIQRILLGVYTALALLLLFLTFSRAAWLGMATGGAVWLGLILSQKGLLSRQGFGAWWQQQSRFWKGSLLAALAVGALIGLLVVVLFIKSFSQAGRSVDLRTDIYTAALELFAEKPITGQGLFTFGRGLVRLPDVQPDKPHSHAHDAVLHIAAELGIIGLIALAATLVVMTRVMRANWRALQGREQIMVAGAIGAVIAFAGHQLGDIPAMMPAIALTGLVALIIALAPANPTVLSVKWTHYAYPMGFAVLWGIILVTGFWSNRVYSDYVSVIADASQTNNYLEAAQRLQTVIDADPNLSLYTMQQAFLFGMEASKGDLDAAGSGLAAYQRFIVLDPGYALAWANMSGLEWQLGDQTEAIKDIQQAIYLDSNVWQYYMTLARYAEALGDTETANNAYDQILKLYPDASLYPGFDHLAARRQISSITLEFTPQAQVALLLENNQIDEANQFWEQNPQPESTIGDVINVLLALAKQDQDGALKWQARAENLANGQTEQAWVDMGRAKIAHFLGQDSLAATELADVQTNLRVEPLDPDDTITANIAYAQFLRLIIPRLFLPQVDYRVDDPVLLYLLTGKQ